MNEEEEFTNSFRKVCDILSAVDSDAARIFDDRTSTGTSQFRALFEKISLLAKHSQVQRSVTHWPFKSFWGSPNEASHSRLIRHLIDPRAEHRCGLFLLQKFLDALFDAEFLKANRDCRVSGKHYIDILIELEGDFAVLVENKVRKCEPGENQVSGYVQTLLDAGYKKERIFPFFLGLTKDQTPHQEDLKALEELGFECGKVTFQEAILGWLRDSLDSFPLHLPVGMRDNLAHYRNHISYLLDEHRGDKMNEKIIAQLQIAGSSGTLPSWEDVNAITRASAELRPSFERFLRGQLLLRLRAALALEVAKGTATPPPCFMLEASPESCTVESISDDKLDQSINLCMKVNDYVRVCFGSWNQGEEPDGSDAFWIGYLRDGDPEQQQEWESRLRPILEEVFPGEVSGDNQPYYFWVWDKETTYRNCQDQECVDHIVRTLIAMQTKVLALGQWTRSTTNV